MTNLINIDNKQVHLYPSVAHEKHYMVTSRGDGHLQTPLKQSLPKFLFSYCKLKQISRVGEPSPHTWDKAPVKKYPPPQKKREKS